MSSANRVRLTYIKEAEGTGYGITPAVSDAANPWKEMRKTSESLSGTPTTTESAEARTDRQSAGTITTGLEVQGGVEYEIAGSDCFKDMYLAGMKYDDTDATHGWAGTKGAWAEAVEDLNTGTLGITFVPRNSVSGDPAYVKLVGNFAEIAASFAAPTASGRNRVKGHIIQLVNPFETPPAEQLNTKNKKAIYIPRTQYIPITTPGDVVGTVTAGSIIGFAKDMVTETGRTALVSVPEMASIGVLDISYTIEKRFTDLVGPAQPGGPAYVKTIVYRGSLVDTMSINFAYGEIATGAFNYVANDHETPIDPIAPDAPGTSVAGPAVAATATAIYASGVSFTASTAGFAGNVKLSFAMNDLPADVVAAWNGTHPIEQQVTNTGNSAFTQAEEVQLQGGKDENTAETLLPVESEIALNASVDVGLVIVDDIPTTYCIQSLSLELNNNSQAQNCIGSIAPEKYTQGSAALTADMTAYLEDSNWLYIEKKIKSTPIQIVYYAVNQDGGIGVNIPELQLSFDDPAATGKDEIVELTISGSARYSSKPELQNSFFMYWLRPADMKEALP